MSTMTPTPSLPSLPDTPELREKLAEIIANVCRCDKEPFLRDEPFTSVAIEFDSLAVLEILLEIETLYHIETDDMVPVDPEAGSQEVLGVFPQNLSELVAYTQEVAHRVLQREAALAGQEPAEALQARHAERLARAQQRTAARPAPARDGDDGDGGGQKRDA